jgi:transposase-like protein
MEAVLCVLRGKPLDAVSREIGVTASSLASWRDDFLFGGQANLKSWPAAGSGVHACTSSVHACAAPPCLD